MELTSDNAPQVGIAMKFVSESSSIAPEDAWQNILTEAGNTVIGCSF